MAISKYILAFVVVVAIVARASVFPSHVADLLDSAMVGQAQKEYSVGSMKVLSALATSGFVGGHLNLIQSSESSCASVLQSETINTDTCLTDGSISFKFQLVTDGCAGAIAQYFHDDACTLYAGSKEIAADRLSCRASGESSFTGLSCSAHKESEEISTLTANEPSAEPTAQPTVAPTAVPSARPTARPTTAYPTMSQNVEVTFAAEQTITGVSCASYNANPTLNENTLKQAVASSMVGVTVNDIQDFSSSCTSSAASPMATVSSFLRSSTGFTTMADVVTISYVVRLFTTIPVSDLMNQLTTATSDGTFDANLHTFATANSATALLTAETEPAETDTFNPYHTNKLSGGGVAAVIIGVVFGVALVALAVYFFVAGGKAGDYSTPKPAGGSGAAEEYTVAL